MLSVETGEKRLKAEEKKIGFRIWDLGFSMEWVIILNSGF